MLKLKEVIKLSIFNPIFCLVLWMVNSFSLLLSIENKIPIKFKIFS